MTKKRQRIDQIWTTEQTILYVLATSYNYCLDDKFPVLQLHLWLHVNHRRQRNKLPPLDRLYFSRVLYRMRSDGLIVRTLWSTPCESNMWALFREGQELP